MEEYENEFGILELPVEEDEYGIIRINE